MRVSKTIIKKILKDNQFSLKMALILDITQASILQQARRNSDKLTMVALVDFYKSEGFTEDEIFEKELKK